MLIFVGSALMKISLALVLVVFGSLLGYFELSFDLIEQASSLVAHLESKIQYHKSLDEVFPLVIFFFATL